MLCFVNGTNFFYSDDDINTFLKKVNEWGFFFNKLSLNIKKGTKYSFFYKASKTTKFHWCYQNW